MDLTVALHTAFVLTAGFSDDVGPAVQIGAAARHDWDTVGISLGLEFRGVFLSGVVAREPLWVDPGEAVPPPEPFAVGQVAAQLVPCVHFAKYLAGCGVVQGSLLLVDHARTSRTMPGWGLGPRLALEVPFADRFAAFGFAEALFPVVGHNQAYGPTEPGSPSVLWSQSDVSGFFGAGLSVKFK